MPIYEYECKACGCLFESVQRFDEKSPPCPKCKSENVERKLSAPSTASKSACSIDTRKTFS